MSQRISDYYRRFQEDDIATIRKEKLRRLAAQSQPFQDVMQVCLNGHKITGRYERSPQDRRDRCQTCGKATMTSCLNCGSKIKGYVWYPNVVSSDDSKVPLFCDSCGEPYSWSEAEEFLATDFGPANVSTLAMNDDLKIIIQNRLDDAGECLETKVVMPIIFSCGSAIEGMLFAYATANSQLYVRSPAAPQENGAVKPISKWSLDELINVANAVKHINDDAKKFAHPLKEFRNYIHIREQIKANFNPDIETAKVCYQVTKLIISNLKRVTTAHSN